MVETLSFHEPQWTENTEVSFTKINAIRGKEKD
jgi:hypothetical protein